MLYSLLYYFLYQYNTFYTVSQITGAASLSAAVFSTACLARLSLRRADLAVAGGFDFSWVLIWDSFRVVV